MRASLRSSLKWKTSLCPCGDAAVCWGERNFESFSAKREWRRLRGRMYRCNGDLVMDMNLATLGFGRKLFSPEHEAYRTPVRRFFKTEIEPNIKRWEKEGCSARELQLEAGKAGILCPGIPEEYGGAGGDMLHEIVLYEEHGYSTAG